MIRNANLLPFILWFEPNFLRSYLRYFVSFTKLLSSLSTENKKPSLKCELLSCCLFQKFINKFSVAIFLLDLRPWYRGVKKIQGNLETLEKHFWQLKVCIKGPKIFSLQILLLLLLFLLKTKSVIGLNDGFNQTQEIAIPRARW